MTPPMLKPTKEQAKDTGMAAVLILLVLGLFQENGIYVKIALALLIIDMTFPALFKPLAVLWIGLSNLLSLVVPKLVISLSFILVVVPIGVVRRMMGNDSLRLKQFKRGTDSVMTKRNHTYVASDLDKPY